MPDHSRLHRHLTVAAFATLFGIFMYTAVVVTVQSNKIKEDQRRLDRQQAQITELVNNDVKASCAAAQDALTHTRDALQAIVDGVEDLVPADHPDIAGTIAEVREAIDVNTLEVACPQEGTP